MAKYEFDSKRWCMSMSKVHHARKDFGTSSTFRSVAEEIDTLRSENERLRGALHLVSLGAQNSMTTKEDLGREARAALGEAECDAKDRSSTRPPRNGSDAG